MNLTKLEICTRIAKRLRIDSRYKVVKPIVDAVFEELIYAMAEGYPIEIRGFGKFKPKIRQKRTARNPRTGELVEIPTITEPHFKFSDLAKKLFEERSSTQAPKVPS